MQHDATEAVPAWVIGAQTGGASAGERKATGEKLAAYFLARGMAAGAVLRAMEGYRLACDPPLSPIDLAEIIGAQASYRDRARGAGIIAPPAQIATVSGWRYAWADTGVSLSIERIASRAGRMDAEIVVTCDLEGKPPELVGPATVNLTSIPAREQFARYLDKRLPLPAWGDILETAFRLAILAHREGAPSVRLAEAIIGEPEGYDIDPLIVAGDPTLVFAAGGVGKSWLALAVAAALDNPHNSPLPLPVITRHRVAYLDWEWSRARHYKRLAMLLDSEQLAACGVLYRRMAGSLASQVDQLARMVETEGVTYIVIDSLGMAAGEDPEKSGSALALANAVRALGVGSLWVSHVAKNTDAQTAFGSAYWMNAVRSAWQAQSVGEAGSSTMRLALYQRKVNDGPPVEPLSLRLDFGRGRVAITRTDIYTEPDFQSQLPAGARVRAVLEQGPATLAEIVGATGLADKPARVAVDRLVSDRRAVELSDGRYTLTIAPARGASNGRIPTSDEAAASIPW